MRLIGVSGLNVRYATTPHRTMSQSDKPTDGVDFGSYFKDGKLVIHTGRPEEWIESRDFVMTGDYV